jgi:hypothetical protein
VPTISSPGCQGCALTNSWGENQEFVSRGLPRASVSAPQPDCLQIVAYRTRTVIGNGGFNGDGNADILWRDNSGLKWSCFGSPAGCQAAQVSARRVRRALVLFLTFGSRGGSGATSNNAWGCLLTPFPTVIRKTVTGRGDSAAILYICRFAPTGRSRPASPPVPQSCLSGLTRCTRSGDGRHSRDALGQSSRSMRKRLCPVAMGSLSLTVPTAARKSPMQCSTPSTCSNSMAWTCSRCRSSFRFY